MAGRFAGARKTRAGSRHSGLDASKTSDDVRLFKDEDEAAVRIQSLWRGKQEREEFLKKKQLLQGDDDGSAEEPGHWCYGPEVMQIRRTLFLLFEEPQSSKLASLVSTVVLTVIVFSVACFILETMPELRGENGEFKESLWGGIEVFCTMVFTAEYLLRLWVCDVMGTGTVRGFLLDPMNMADLLAVLPFYITLTLSSVAGGRNSLRMLRAIRLLRITRLVKLGRYSAGMRLMGEALRNSVQALWVLAFLICIGVVLFSSLLFYAEQLSCPLLESLSDAEQRTRYMEDCAASPDGFSKEFGLCCNSQGSPLDFPSIIHACWWSVVTMTTVGFGDVYPRTWAGRLVGTGAMLMGILIIALPVAIVGRKFQEVYDKHTSDAEQVKVGDGVVGLIRSKQPMGRSRWLPPEQGSTGLNLDNIEVPRSPFAELGVRMKQMSVSKKERDGIPRDFLEQCGYLADDIQAAEEQQASMYRVDVVELFRQDEVYQRVDQVIDGLTVAKRRLRILREQAQKRQDREIARFL